MVGKKLKFWFDTHQFVTICGRGGKPLLTENPESQKESSGEKINFEGVIKTIISSSNNCWC